MPNYTETSELQQSRQLVGIGIAIGGTFLFALKSIFIKAAFAHGADATLLLTLRMLLSAPFYVAMLIWLRSKRSSTAPNAQSNQDRFRTIASAILLGFLGYYLASLLDMLGLERISAQLERLTLFVYPTMIAILAAIFLDERLTKRVLASIGMCYAGILVMFLREQATGGLQTVGVGVLLVLGSALSYSVYVILAKPMIKKMGSREFTSYAMLGSAVFIAAHFVATRSVDELWVSEAILGYSLLIAFVCTVIPSFLINEAIGRIGATRTSIIGSAGPVMTMLLAICVLQEPSSVWHFVGMLIVIAGVTLVSKK